MATYTEIRNLINDSGLLARVVVACVVEADVIRQEDVGTTGHTERLAWARETLLNPEAMAPRMLWAVLAQNKAQTVATIQAATDAALQSAVSVAVNLIAGV